MEDRGFRRGAGAPFYAPPRRKTSAEIISEARAAIGGELSSMSSGALGALRPLRTRRPFTPREPQRTLFTERPPKRDPRPPSAFDLKYLTLSEGGEQASLTASVETFQFFEEDSNDDFDQEPQKTRKKPPMRQSRTIPERLGDGWSGFTKLPHLSGRQKPLHRRNTAGHPATDIINLHPDLSQAISVTRPLGPADETTTFGKKYNENQSTKAIPDPKRKQLTTSKSISYETDVTAGVAVTSLETQLPSSSDSYENMSVLEISEALTYKSKDVERILILLGMLQKIIEKTSPANSLRDLVLRSLYAHVDSEDEKVLVAIARAMLTLRVTGPHLAATCKLIFKIARNDKNDHFFLSGNLLELLVEGCGRIEPVSESESCIYAAGALRFLALEPRLCRLAHRVGALHIAALHLKILNNASSESRGQERVAQAQYQVAGALRALAGDVGCHAAAFAHCGALPELLAALRAHTDRDLLTNVARCLSVLSAEESCCAVLCGAGAGGARALVRALAASAARAPLAVRLAYTLGNMAAVDTHAALHIYEEEGSVDVLLTILESYTQRIKHDVKDPESDPEARLLDSDLGGSDGSYDDVIIKTIRVLANLCLAEAAGRGVAAEHAERTVLAILACLELAETPKSEMAEVAEEVDLYRAEQRSELALAALAALNNVTFYLQSPPASALFPALDRLCLVACRWAAGTDAKAGVVAGPQAVAGAVACEAVRVLGNVSRWPRAAQLLVMQGALPTLAAHQRHEDPSVRCAAAGVLVNVCGAGIVGGNTPGENDTDDFPLGNAGTVAGAAVAGAEACATTCDAAAGALLARALWNAHANSPLSPALARRAYAALSSLLDDESAFVACEGTKHGERRTSDPQINKTHVNFDLDAGNNRSGRASLEPKSLPANDRAVEFQDSDDDGDLTGCSGEDLGFEDGDWECCECDRCRRLAAWEELASVAVPLLERLKPTRAHAAVGTD